MIFVIPVVSLFKHDTADTASGPDEVVLLSADSLAQLGPLVLFSLVHIFCIVLSETAFALSDDFGTECDEGVCLKLFNFLRQVHEPLSSLLNKKCLLSFVDCTLDFLGLQLTHDLIPLMSSLWSPNRFSLDEFNLSHEQGLQGWSLSF